MEGIENTIWTIVIIATLGVASIALLIYQYGIKKKIYCPTCESKLTILTKSVEETKKEIREVEQKTKKEEVLEKMEMIKEQEEEIETTEAKKIKRFCEYCRTDLSEFDENLLFECPGCGAVFK